MQERRAVAPLTRGALRTLTFATAAAIVVADRVTTSLALNHLHGVRHVWGPFGLALGFNSGVAFSLFSGRALIVTVLLGAGVAGLAFVVAQAAKRTGTASNATGHHGQVPDFITLSHWPTFNVADAGVTVGVIVVAASLLFGRPAHPDTPAS